ncbi:MAG: Fe-S cluster assembly protein SufD [Planctomycetota bacterium]|jgi:Fe-S cluster assembly protein SufD
MIEVKENTGVDLFGSHFELVETRVAPGGQAWFLPTRRAAMARFAELGFPTTRHEEWRYTNVAPIARTPFGQPGHDGARVSPEQIAPCGLGGAEAASLVFVDGYYAPNLSSPGSQPEGVSVESLGAALEAGVPIVKAHFARHSSYEDHAFTVLNTALMEDGAFIHIPRSTVVTAPVHLLFVSTSDGKPIASHPRNLIVADTSSQVTVVETYVGLGSGTHFTNTVTEVVVGENAVVDHYKVERGADGAFHVGTLQLHQQRSSTVSSYTASLGGGLVRNDISAVLNGEGCECTLNGLYMVTDTQHVDNHLVVDHAKPHCHSRESFKGVLDGHGRGIFSGRIIVRDGAQKTDAKQSNMSLLLSKDAQVESKPQLEIFADDVKCTHGATIGQVSEEAIFYLRSRGISEEAARSLLVYAFANESVGDVRVEPLREQLARLLFARLPQGQLFREVV